MQKEKNDYDGIVLGIIDDLYITIFNDKTRPMFNKIAVLRTGTMGYRITQFFAQNQIIVIGYDTNEAMLSKARNRLNGQEGMEKHLSFTSDLKEAISDAD